MILTDTKDSQASKVIDSADSWEKLYKELSGIIAEGYHSMPSNHAPFDDNYNYKMFGFSVYMKMKNPIILWNS
tara:strand:- start:678 stop:896 length:219 start_codon:yes stop_codon:yes gene_type:complete